MPDLLQIGGITEEMRTRLAAAFTIRQLDDFEPEKITHVVTNGHAGIDPDLMARLPNLKVISGYGVGYDAVDADEAARRGIIVTHTPNVLNEEVATTAILLLLACYREVLRDDAYVRSGAWETGGNAALTRSVDNQTVGIVGLGRIGQAIAEKLAPWNTKVLYHARNRKDVAYRYYENLTEMAHDSDVLICITPGGPGTHQIVNAEVMEALGSKGTLINVSRGSVVDEQALIEALETGKLGWAGLDVFENEPQVPEALRALPNTVLLPHVGSATVETRSAMGALTVDNLLQHLKDGTVISAVPECAHL
ncbi:Glyoxylate reductase [Sulfitobacter noctilucicola]|uniref:Lactate dehydrogenase-like 2-hydroxyacid dehydrogenase n=1 Tax=Sulfitobacter noctilucicola TaxID=1342301 RepID=A0A7W6MCU2_9RHOB|nr:2-hydroxyacid dehydrogenase [Sulfitobacter noctilucicola]KIN70177.1 Glyoxylate reductase [Sulfitobacter noctilucicola]MBB4176178.1 lactate dehydrogenase-like 2-hydroxyacid dehydrogenase [Sulfitobacter noctilucicola]